MAQNLKLEIFRIAIKKRHSKSKDFLNFNELFMSIEENKSDAYKKFVSDYRNLFDGKFKADGKGTKGISTTAANEFKIRSAQNIIDGEVFGGNIGSVQTIYNQNDSAKVVGKIDFDQIASLPFYIKLWTPLDYNAGIFMIQNYSDHTVSDLIKITLRKFFADYGFTLVISPFIPEVIKNDYLKKSHVYEMKIINDNVSMGKRKLLNPIFADYPNLKIEVKISGFKTDVSSFWDSFKRKGKHKLIGSNLDDLDISAENGYEIKAYYKDEEGHLANVGMGNTFDISPTIFLPESLKMELTHHFDFKKITKFTDGILGEIKKEIGYK